MIPFISRHIPTPAQRATVAERFGELACTDPVIFEPGTVSRACWAAAQSVGAAYTRLPCPHDHPSGHDCDCDQVVAGVFPGWALLELLRAGWTVVEFRNEPSAREHGAFVCLGAFVHRAEIERDVVSVLPSEFIPCPIPVGAQGSSPLLAGIRPTLN